ncbi:hypothetical protein JCM19294_2176 [Nonlabens tegetincola]|uniref:DUF5103 domain-containing protein n=2 Tax=Nonlabens tegetincola TaxID=323273 RepID=A0A090PX07_9FLAO|nr:hypothetical protein JCM19294_2176 [Nonlabens tegetincola]
MGNYNGFQVSDENMMIPSENGSSYSTTLTLKQGFYNYKYAVVHPDGRIDYGFVAGNNWQTENEYTVLAYFREIGGRYDRLIGKGSANSRNITN